MRFCRIVVVMLVVAAAFAGCGGGGSSDPNVIPYDPPPTGENQAPSITSVSPTSPVSVQSDEQRTIVIGATDPDGDPLTYSWSTDRGTLVKSSENDYTGVFTAPHTSSPTTCTVRVSVSDNQAHTTSASIVFNVSGATDPGNEPPVINSVTANPASVGAGETSVLTVDATDPDGDNLSYVWFPDAGAVESKSGTSVTWRAPGVAGKYTVNVSVGDGKNAAVLGKVEITVAGGSGGTVVNGLTATYVQNSGNMAHPVLNQGKVVETRVDPAVNFDWGQGSPLPELVTGSDTGNADDFGVRWTGHVLCQAAGTYVFKVRYDDGARVWITNDQNKRVLLVDGWSTGPKVLEGSISLDGNKWYPITVEHFEAKSSSYVQLSWTPPGGSEQIVPSNKLRAD